MLSELQSHSFIVVTNGRLPVRECRLVWHHLALYAEAEFKIVKDPQILIKQKCVESHNWFADHVKVTILFSSTLYFSNPWTYQMPELHFFPRHLENLPESSQHDKVFWILQTPVKKHPGIKNVHLNNSVQTNNHYEINYTSTGWLRSENILTYQQSMGDFHYRQAI